MVKIKRVMYVGLDVYSTCDLSCDRCVKYCLEEVVGTGQCVETHYRNNK